MGYLLIIGMVFPFIIMIIMDLYSSYVSHIINSNKYSDSEKIKISEKFDKLDDNINLISAICMFFICIILMSYFIYEKIF